MPIFFLALLGIGGYFLLTKKAAAAPSPPALQPQWPTTVVPGVVVPAVAKELELDAQWFVDPCIVGVASLKNCVEGIDIDLAIQAAQAGGQVSVNFTMSRGNDAASSQKFNVWGMLAGAKVEDGKRYTLVQIVQSPSTPGAPPVGAAVVLTDGNWKSWVKGG